MTENKSSLTSLPPELEAQFHSIRVLRNTIKLLLKTNHAGSDAQGLVEALTFLDKLVTIQEKEFELLKAQHLTKQV